MPRDGDDFTEANTLRACSGRPEREALLAELFQRHRERLRLMVRIRLDGRLQGRLDPSDALQEVYLEASRRVDEYARDVPMPFFIWLRFLTGQKIHDLHDRHIRYQKRSVRRERRLETAPAPEANSGILARHLEHGGPSPSAVAMQTERRDRIQAALDDMQLKDREILALRFFEQLSNAEAAQMLSVREETARKRYFRALGKLRSLLGEESVP